MSNPHSPTPQGSWRCTCGRAHPLTLKCCPKRLLPVPQPKASHA